MKSTWIVVAVLALAPVGRAQEPRAVRERIVMEKMARAAVEGKVTPGAPYSAEAVNESTQTLADGNRIVQKSLTRVYRDSEGRTRREDVAENGEVLSVSIVDPVAHVSYVLDPKTRTASRGAMMIARSAVFNGQPVSVVSADDRKKIEAANAIEEQKLRVPPPPPPPPQPLRTAPPPPPPPPPPGYKGVVMGEAAESTEDLGRQSVEGVAADGTRTTWTIAAGAIGNLQPIRIVSEQWFSPDLQLLVLTKHSDPRTGENTYRLQNVVRAEPDRSLFSVPPDYTMKESGIRKE
jgi:hypothetical protein